MFKHALTQEVVYNGLLKTEREKLHERIALVMEQVFQDRLPEFYETLAFHFKQGQSVLKAIDYLMKSGEKSLKRYAVEESHRSYSEAFRLLNNKVDKSDTEQSLLIGLVLEWCQVFYYRGDAIGLVELLQAHEDLALSIGDKDRVGMLYAWFGYVLFWREKYKESYDYLTKALRFGEETKNGQLIAYACTWLPYTCAELGLFDEGIQHGKRAQDISKTMSEDRYLYIKSLSGIGYIHFFRGERKELLQLSKYGLEYGKRHSDLRSLGMSHTGIGLSHLIAGDFTSAIECCKKAVLVSEDPIYSMAFRTMLSFSYLSGSHFQEAEDTAQEVLSFVQRYGVDWLGTMVRIVLGVVLIAKGHMGQGLKKLKELQPLLISNESKWLYAQSEYILGNVYLQIVEGTEQRSLSLLVKNIGFLIKNIPFAHKKAENHFNKAIEAAGAIGANGILGQAHLGLGLLHKAKKKKGRARECVSYAIQIFEQCDAEVFLAQAKEVLESLR
jgi:tetratricopeptide (TPR) repeat protein